MAWLTVLSWGARALPFLKSAKGVASIVGLVGVVALYLYVGHLQNKAEEWELSAGQYQKWYEAATMVIGTKDAAIAELEAANKSLAESITIREEERIAAAVEAAERELEARLALDNTLDELEDMRNETPSCAELSKIDMGAVCPSVVDRLREHADGSIGRD